MATREEIKVVIGYMSMAFPNYHPDITSTPNSIDVMFDLLGDMPGETLLAAVKSCCASGREFAPSAGQIREAAVNLHMRAAGVPSAGEAWAAVIGSFVRMPSGVMSGGGHSPILDNPIVQEAVKEMGGYNAIGIDFYDNQMVNRAHFFKIYAALLTRKSEEAATLPAVSGYIESQRAPEVKQLAERMAK